MVMKIEEERWNIGDILELNFPRPVECIFRDWDWKKEKPKNNSKIFSMAGSHHDIMRRVWYWG